MQARRLQMHRHVAIAITTLLAIYLPAAVQAQNFLWI